MKNTSASAARVASLALALQIVAASSVHAAGPVFKVNSVADVPDATIDGICGTGAVCNGVPCCTLRAAVMEASHSQSAEEVTIELPAGSYLLSIPISADTERDGDLNVSGHVRIVGTGFDQSIIDANHVDRAIRVASTAVVTLSDLRIQNGRPPDSDFRTADGAGILNDEGQLTVSRCLVRANGSLSGWSGAGIYSKAGTLNVVDSVVRINGTAGLGKGGGIFTVDTATTIARSTVNSNSAMQGGGLYAYQGTLQVVNSTFTGNAADAGGGIYTTGVVAAAFRNVTVSANTASGAFPAGEDAFFNGSSAVLSNSIFYDGDLGCGGGATVASNGYNMIWAVGNCAVDGSYKDPGLQLNDLFPLAANGGPTLTFALRPDSPTVDGGNPSGCLDSLGAPLATDQRGVNRQIGAHCDLGAFEVEPLGDANGDGVVNAADILYLINTLFAGGPVPRGRADINIDGAINVSDVLYLINFLFAGGF